MAQGIFITGTNTDVGKTFATALIVKKLHEAQKKVAYYKAAISGNIRDAKGELIPGDATYVKKISGISQTLKSMCPYIYEHAVSPHLASQIEGNPVKLEVVKNGFQALTSHYDFITLEGSGGILCPLTFENEKIFLEDIIKMLGLTSIIVASAGLGTINAVVLTVAYMRQKNLPIAGIIYNHYHEGNFMEDDNIKMCEQLTGLPTIARLNDNCTDFPLSAEQLLSYYKDVKISR